MKRTASRARFLASLRRQSAAALAGDWSGAEDLVGLLAELKRAPPRARSVTYRGVRFPLAWSLSCTVVCCPKTGTRLIGRLDI